MKTKLLVQLRKEAVSSFRLERDSDAKYKCLWKYSKNEDKWRLKEVYIVSQTDEESIRQDVFRHINDEFYKMAEKLLSDRKNKVKYPW